MSMVQGMLSHTLIKEASYLEGLHATAFNRICNQVWPQTAVHSIILIASACPSWSLSLPRPFDKEQTPPVTPN